VLYLVVSSTNVVCGIYAIRHIATGRCYVGSSVRIVYRWKQHRTQLERGTHHGKHLQRAWSKYGADAFEFVVLEQVDSSQLVAREQFHIDALNAAHPDLGFNTAPVAGSVLGCRHGPCSDERKRRIGAANRGRKPSRLAVERSLAARTGRPLSAAHKEKMSAVQTARRAAEKAARPPKPDTRAFAWLTEQAFAEAVALYQSGATMDAVAARFNITKSSFSSRMKRRGIPARKWRGGRPR
jgi:group I intron endonuclease